MLFGCLVVWLVGWLVGWLAGRLGLAKFTLPAPCPPDLRPANALHYLLHPALSAYTLQNLHSRWVLASLKSSGRCCIYLSLSLSASRLDLLACQTWSMGGLQDISLQPCGLSGISVGPMQQPRSMT